MNLLETSPADWLRAMLEKAEGVREVGFDVPPFQRRLLLITASGQRFHVTVSRAEI